MTKTNSLHPLIKNSIYLLSLLYSSGISWASVSVASDAAQNQPFKEEPIEIQASPLTFDPQNPAQKTFGKLIWRGGLVLKATSTHFGGLSGLVMMDPAGESFIAITDRGFWLNGHIEYKDGAPLALKKTHLGPLLNKNGQPLSSAKARSDTEALVFHKNKLLVSFERRHRISEFSLNTDKPGRMTSQITMPKDLRQMKSNDGLEAVDIFKDGPHKGALIAFSESLEQPEGFIKGWLIKQKKTQSLRLRRLKGFSITDMKTLPDGGLLILERDYKILDGVKMRIRHVRAQDVSPDKDMTGYILLEANNSFSIDNMEGLDLHTDQDGKRIITVISDDNFKSYQRTLLLQFEWPQEK